MCSAHLSCVNEPETSTIPQTKLPAPGKQDLLGIQGLGDMLKAKPGGLRDAVSDTHLTPWKPELSFNVVLSSGGKTKSPKTFPEWRAMVN